MQSGNKITQNQEKNDFVIDIEKMLSDIKSRSGSTSSNSSVESQTSTSSNKTETRISFSNDCDVKKAAEIDSTFKDITKIKLMNHISKWL